MLEKTRLREFMRQHPLPDKQLQQVMEGWMTSFVEEIIDGFKEEQNKLATKDDFKQVIEMFSVRFEEIDKRFESLQNSINKRFEAIDKRFEALQREMDKRFEAQQIQIATLQREMDKHFEAQQIQIATLQREISIGFKSVNERLIFMQWIFGGGMGIGLLLIILRLFFPHIFPQ